ncbi:MAG: S-adenosyl-L-homocysteine hydrolase [Dinoroseobacter sp.]|nr:S-adenosyl-L-homocysteine hydrolase [Dinoroseobacter sp.]
MFKWFFVLFALLPFAAAASDGCMLADEMDATLVDWYGERVVAQTQNGNAALWRNELTGSWTIVEYFEDGLACVLVFGDPDTTDGQEPELLAQLSL